MLTQCRNLGGDHALCDAGDALEPILQLANKAKNGQAVGEEDYPIAVQAFESKMIPRAFEAVKESGAISQAVGDSQSGVTGIS